MRKKLLVVERDVDILQIVKIIFEERGFVVDVYETEENVLLKIIESKPDVVILDIIKPTLEGTALCRAIKATETTKHIPVIVMSTHMKAEKVKEVCADEVMSKPFNIDELIDVVEAQLSSYN